MNLLAMTPEQLDRILALCEQLFEVGANVGSVVGPLIMAILWRNQHLNKKSFTSKLDENTEVTKQAKETLDEMAIFRGMVSRGKHPGDGRMTEFSIDLPGHSYERFTLSEGSAVMWKTEECESGKIARFIISGPATMGFHCHDVTEELEIISGVLEIVTNAGKFHFGPGQKFSSPPGEIHSVGFCGYGEVVAHWLEQNNNQLNIRIYQ